MKSRGMRSLLSCMVLLSLTAYGSFASAESKSFSPAYTIDKIFNYSTYAIVRITPSNPVTFTNGQCGPLGNVFVINFGADPNLKVLYNTALAAFMLGKTIGYGVTNDCFAWNGGVPSAYRIDIQ